MVSVKAVMEWENENYEFDIVGEGHESKFLSHDISSF